ncbi:MAG: S-layer homology domain-containing protein [Oscillospiraceae bacterium]|nr:S-layer homology domain-containing protein [Oscillospiraceae bacterium]
MEKTQKTQNAKFVRFVLAAAGCFALLFAAMVASATAVAAAPAEPATEAATAVPIVPINIEIEATANDGYNESPVDIDVKMKEALTAVKKVIDVDDKTYPNFSYYYYPDGYGSETWNFNWYSTDGNANINVTVLGSGRILYYGKYEYNEKNDAKQAWFAELTKAQAAKLAETFLKKMLGSEFAGYRLYQQFLGYPSDRYNLVYILAKNGYDYPEFQIYADVDKITGDILSFSNYNYTNYNYAEEPKFDYQNTSDVISKEDALKAYLEKIGLELVYTSYYDYAAREQKVHPVYRLKNNYGEYISAADGSVVDITGGFSGIVPLGGVNDAAAPEAESAGGYGGVSFSDAELAELARARNYITAEQAIDIMAKAFDLDPAGLENLNKSTYLQSDYMDKDKYLWSVSLYSYSDTTYENHYASLDAETGTIMYYSGGSYPVYGYGKDYDSEGRYTYEEAKAIVMKKIKELCPKNIETEFEFSAQSYEGKEPYYYFNFTRKVNGILFESNNLYVTFDNISGKISSYSFQWFDKAVFPKLDKLVSPAKALANIAEYVGYDICYASTGITEDGKINAVLVYKFGGSVMADPFTGKCIGWDFKEAALPEAEPDYKDLENHWNEEKIWRLTNNGIYVWGGEKFDPDADITQGEFVSYLKFFVYNSYYFTRMESSIFVNAYAYRLMESYGADAGKILTKQEAAKIVCELAGYGELGQHTEIFNYPFNDDNCDEAYRGYVAIIKAFGLILGDDKGNYDGTKNLTRAEAASIIYNIVMTFSRG